MSKEVKAKLVDAYKGMGARGRAQATQDLMRVLSARQAVSGNTK